MLPSVFGVLVTAFESSDADPREEPLGGWLSGDDFDSEADGLSPTVVLNVLPTSGSDVRDAGGLTDVSLDDAMEDWDGEGEAGLSLSEEEGSADATVGRGSVGIRDKGWFAAELSW